MKSKFQKVAAKLQPMIPNVDDPFWNGYRNMGSNPKLIKIPVHFFKANEEIAYAEFKTLPSTRQLMWMALYKVLEDAPDLNWDSVRINNGVEYPKEQVENIFKEDMQVRLLGNVAPSVQGAMRDFFENIAALNGQGLKARESLTSRYNEIQADFVTSICLQAYDIQWHKGAPPKNMLSQVKRFSRLWL